MCKKGREKEGVRFIIQQITDSFFCFVIKKNLKLFHKPYSLFHSFVTLSERYHRQVYTSSSTLVEKYSKTKQKLQNNQYCKLQKVFANIFTEKKSQRAEQYKYTDWFSKLHRAM